MKGYDVYLIEMDLFEFLEYIHLHNIAIYRLQKNKAYHFLSTYKYRNILNEHKMIHYQYSVGIMGMFFRFNLEKIVSLILSCIVLFGLSNTIFELEVIGESIVHKEMIQNQLNHFKVPFFYLNEKNISTQLNQLYDDLNWFEINRKGSNIQINYLPRYDLNVENSHSLNLIAEKEGVIASFDVRKGNKVVSLNQKVNKGDLLISNIVIDTQFIEKNSSVIGSVYAYTFQKVEIELKNIYPIGLGYSICLLKSRMLLELENDEKIIREISLHFSEDLDTIRMSNFYVLYEKISIVGD